MKKQLYIVIILLAFNNCKAQKSTKMEQNIIIPEVTKEFETFDIEKFNTQKINGQEIINTDNELIIFIDYANGYNKSIYIKNSSFSIVKNFYLNGKIEIKGITFNNGSEYGIWYIYNEKGELIKEINTDEGYDFGWEQIINYCKKNQIKLEKGYPKQGGIKTEIYKNEEEGKKVWTISYYDYKKEKYLEVTLDGKTGKELKRRELELIGS